MARLELYGTARCPYTEEMREWLEWKRSDFVEYDVEADPVARARMRDVAGGQRTCRCWWKTARWSGRLAGTSCIVDVE